MEAVKLRKALLSDDPLLLEFEQKVLATERPYNSAIKLTAAYYYDLEVLLTSTKSYLAIAEVADTVVGSGYAQIRESKQSLTHDFYSYLSFMYVAPEYRGRGINKSIIKSLIQWSKKHGISACYLDIYGENKAAIQAYEKVGFVTSMIKMKLNLA